MYLYKWPCLGIQMIQHLDLNKVFLPKLSFACCMPNGLFHLLSLEQHLQISLWFLNFYLHRLTGKFPLPAEIARRVLSLPGTVQVRWVWLLCVCCWWGILFKLCLLVCVISLSRPADNRIVMHCFLNWLYIWRCSRWATPCRTATIMTHVNRDTTYDQNKVQSRSVLFQQKLSHCPDVFRPMQRPYANTRHSIPLWPVCSSCWFFIQRGGVICRFGALGYKVQSSSSNKLLVPQKPSRFPRMLWITKRCSMSWSLPRLKK